MANIVQTGTTELRTTLPQLQVAQPKADTTASNIGALGEAAATGYKAFLVNKAQDKASEVVSQLNTDLENAKQAGNLEDMLNANLIELDAEAKNNPALQEYVSTLKTLDTASKQKKLAPLMLRLRAEKAMKEVVNMAPGLRPEIASITRTTLGFDPSGATMDAILSGLDEDAKAADKQRTWYADHLGEKLLGYGLVPPMSSNGVVDIPRAEIMFAKYNNIENEKKALEESLKRGDIKEADNISNMSGLIQREVSLRYDFLFDSASNIFSTVKDSGQYEQASKLIPQLSNIQRQLESSIRNSFNTVNVSGKNRDLLNQEIERVVASSTSGIKAILESKDKSEFETRSQVFEYMKNEMKMDWFNANQALGIMMETSPGLIPQIYSQVMAGENGMETNRRIQAMIRKGISDADPATIKRMDFSNMLDVMQDSKAFDGINDDEKLAVFKHSYGMLQGTLKDYSAGKELDDLSLTALARSYSVVAQLADEGISTDTKALALISSHPQFSKIVEKLNDMGGDNAIRAEIMADSGIKSMTKYLRELGPDLLKSIQADGYTFDVETGKLVGDASGVVGHYKTIHKAQVAAAVKAYNSAIDGVYKLASHDPSISSLSREEIAEYFSMMPLKNAGVTIVGKPRGVTVRTVKQQEQDKLASFEEQITNLSRQLEDAKLQLQQSRTIQNLPKKTEELVQVTNSDGSARYTDEGRPVYKDRNGEYVTEKTVTITDDRINGGKPTNIPTVYNGKILSEDEAADLVVKSGGKDPITGRVLESFNSIEEAVKSAQSRSYGLGVKLGE